jgi:hypothetical protein
MLNNTKVAKVSNQTDALSNALIQHPPRRQIIMGEANMHYEPERCML